MDVVNFEPTVPSPLSIEKKREFFVLTNGSDGYPPHLNLAGNKPAADVEASKVQKSSLAPTDIFNQMRLLQLSTLLRTVMPENFIRDRVGDLANLSFGGMGRPDAGEKLEDVEEYNRKMRAKWMLKDIYNLPNVGDLNDWYTDARFAQQHLTGTNPTTIERASKRWIKHFATASQNPADKRAKEIVTGLNHGFPESLYVQDYSYFREAAGMDKSAVIKCEFDETYVEEKNVKSRKIYHYGCASVCLFYLNESGSLQPLAIIVDWRGSAAESVTIYNRELVKRDPFFQSLDARGGKDDQASETVDEAHDWAWRYGGYSDNLKAQSTNILTAIQQPRHAYKLVIGFAMNLLCI